LEEKNIYLMLNQRREKLGGGRRGGGLSKMRKEGRLNGLNRKYQF
jgi:hypothetical protein